MDLNNSEFVIARRRVNQFDDTIDRFVRVLTEAHGSALAMEKAKLAYIDSLPLQIKKDLGYA